MKQIHSKGIPDKALLCLKGDPRGIVQEIKI